ncbi:hypothetical protein MRX96_012326 [Rhipicephalus microplus]
MHIHERGAGFHLFPRQTHARYGCCDEPNGSHLKADRGKREESKATWRQTTDLFSSLVAVPFPRAPVSYRGRSPTEGRQHNYTQGHAGVAGEHSCENGAIKRPSNGSHNGVFAS